MNNNDIEIVENYLAEQDRKFVSQYRLKFLQAVENILEDRERLKKENEEYKIKENSRICGKYNQVEIHELIEKTIQKDYIDKANKYDRLVERIKEVRNSLEKDGFVGYEDELMDILEGE